MRRSRGNVITRATTYEQPSKFTKEQDESYENGQGTSVTVACSSVHTLDMTVPQNHEGVESAWLDIETSQRVLGLSLTKLCL